MAVDGTRVVGDLRSRLNKSLEQLNDVEKKLDASRQYLSGPTLETLDKAVETFKTVRAIGEQLRQTTDGIADYILKPFERSNVRWAIVSVLIGVVGILASFFAARPALFPRRPSPLALVGSGSVLAQLALLPDSPFNSVVVPPTNSEKAIRSNYVELGNDSIFVTDLGTGDGLQFLRNAYDRPTTSAERVIPVVAMAATRPKENDVWRGERPRGEFLQRRFIALRIDKDKNDDDLEVVFGGESHDGHPCAKTEHLDAGIRQEKLLACLQECSTNHEFCTNYVASASSGTLKEYRQAFEDSANQYNGIFGPMNADAPEPPTNAAALAAQAIDFAKRLDANSPDFKEGDLLFHLPTAKYWVVLGSRYLNEAYFRDNNEHAKTAIRHPVLWGPSDYGWQKPHYLVFPMSCRDAKICEIAPEIGRLLDLTRTLLVKKGGYDRATKMLLDPISRVVEVPDGERNAILLYR